jgi:hypothetical protein
MPPLPREVPGFYYDPEKNRYFPNVASSRPLQSQTNDASTKARCASPSSPPPPRSMSAAHLPAASPSSLSKTYQSSVRRKRQQSTRLLVSCEASEGDHDTSRPPAVDRFQPSQPVRLCFKAKTNLERFALLYENSGAHQRTGYQLRDCNSNNRSKSIWTVNLNNAY